MVYKDKDKERQAKLRYSRSSKAKVKKLEYNQHPDVKERNKEYQREYSKDDKVRARKRAWHIKMKYNITQEDYDFMLQEQNNLCALCGKLMFDDIVIDHNHKTGEVRGLIHHKCNIGIGMFNDNSDILRLAAEYIDIHNGDDNG